MSDDQRNSRVPPRERAADDRGETPLPPELSQFSRRLASFGLGEAPDPLLTPVRPAKQRRGDG
jgi:hypothetical protein